MMLLSPSMGSCIKDSKHKVFHESEVFRDITPYSCLKAYHKDPLQRFDHQANTKEIKMSEEVFYNNHSPIPSMHSSGSRWYGSPSPPVFPSIPSFDCRRTYGGGGSHGQKGMVDPASLAHRYHPRRVRTGAFFSSSSAIAERRDVKPDGGNNQSLLRDGGSYHPQYHHSASLNEREGHRRISSCCSSPPMLTAGMVDVGVLGIPGGVQQYRASIKPLMGFEENMEHHGNSVHRWRSRRSWTPPLSPHRGNELQMFNGQVTAGANQVSLQRTSPVHHFPEFNSRCSGLTVDGINQRGSSSSTSSVFLDSPLRQPDAPFLANMATCNSQSERMTALEEQIAALAGLVHRALSAGSDALGQKEAISQIAEEKLLSNQLESSSDSKLPDRCSSTSLTRNATSFDGRLRQNLMSVKRNICELRLQLRDLRRLQQSNLESASAMLRMAGPELVMLIREKLAQSEEAAYRQRAEMEEDRIRYLATEEKLLTQISELEDYVDCLRRLSSVVTQPSFTLSDVEEGEVRLRRLGDALAVHRGAFPVLRAKMVSVLRVEVEAVRFLREEPHKMDSMLKRVKAQNETLESLRRHLSDSSGSLPKQSF